MKDCATSCQGLKCDTFGGVSTTTLGAVYIVCFLFAGMKKAAYYAASSSALEF